ncbi:TetR/AcrR family transcriptional regulator C-terminal domain-containing protein [Nocardia farcinica]|uniref:Putative transcriptional regulator n=1 Tax=Nocardia farcinica (strain IFM 10152) TaxID=247156 RepID=Q5YXD7_NOCFA|nr:TetR/AcrR family transcriptional regulator C-terminal domain-containing protein [Nocardia farcinica]MBF6541215.1 TetR/AcrR family transcriptional regulator C-terminal domain-containing protein [Nocardia farcinica]BAD57154.1 putative transcriptional regulator [Nocardia farcinica IFM 10152]
MAEPRRGVWFEDARGGRKPRLSRERIVEAAVGLLDAEGVEGFSMRRLAARLQAGTMSLYEYVAGKEDVLDLALDAALADIPLGDDGADWETALAERLRRFRRTMRRHPWIPRLLGTRPLLGPNALARSERTYADLLGAGLTGPGLVAAVSALTAYVQGFVTSELAWRSWVRDPADEAGLRRDAQERIAAHAQRYPTLHEHARLADADFDAGFEHGLRIILDGVRARAAAGDAR